MCVHTYIHTHIYIYICTRGKIGHYNIIHDIIQQKIRRLLTFNWELSCFFWEGGRAMATVLCSGLPCSPFVLNQAIALSEDTVVAMAGPAWLSHWSSIAAREVQSGPAEARVCGLNAAECIGRPEASYVRVSRDCPTLTKCQPTLFFFLSFANLQN